MSFYDTGLTYELSQYFKNSKVVKGVYKGQKLTETQIFKFLKTCFVSKDIKNRGKIRYFAKFVYFHYSLNFGQFLDYFDLIYHFGILKML